jgi:ribulose-phosphate 3-epimerase
MKNMPYHEIRKRHRALFLDRSVPLLCPSILSCDLANLASSVRAIENAADVIHCDIMDGRFVPNLTFGAPVLESLASQTSLPLDMHLMVEYPSSDMLRSFARAGALVIVVHAETVIHLQRTLSEIRELGCFAGVALNPATPLDNIRWVLPDIDMLLLMTVNPGFGGQSFIPQMKKKIEQARAMIDTSGCDIRLQIDGGINISNVEELVYAGADMVVAGSAIFGADDPAAAAENMRTAMRRAHSERLTSRSF